MFYICHLYNRIKISVSRDQMMILTSLGTDLAMCIKCMYPKSIVSKTKLSNSHPHSILPVYEEFNSSHCFN